jgi:hypothetical protein
VSLVRLQGELTSPPGPQFCPLLGLSFVMHRRTRLVTLLRPDQAVQAGGGSFLPPSSLETSSQSSEGLESSTQSWHPQLSACTCWDLPPPPCSHCHLRFAQVSVPHHLLPLPEPSSDTTTVQEIAGHSGRVQAPGSQL